nr:unnamed protein product [Leishmania braziliensis]
MGCVNCRALKLLRSCRKNAEEASGEKKGEPRAVAEQTPVAPNAYTATSAANPFPSAERKDTASPQTDVSADVAPEEAVRDRGWGSKEEGNSKGTAGTDSGSIKASLDGELGATESSKSNGETSEERKDNRQRGRNFGGNSSSGISLSLSINDAESAKDRSSSSQAHKSTKGREEKAKKHGSSSSTITAEVCLQGTKDDIVAHSQHHSEPYSQATGAGSSTNGVTVAGTISSINLHQAGGSTIDHGSSNASLDVCSSAAPAVMDTKICQSEDAPNDDAGRGGKTRRYVPAVVPALAPSMQNGRAATEVSYVSSRTSFEPYSDFGPRDGDDYLPPYEWAPRALPVSSPLRACGPVDMARWEYGENQLYGLTVAGETACFQDPMLSFADEDATVSDPVTPEVNYGASYLSLHTFYPRLPPARGPSSNAEGNDNMSREPAEAFNYPSVSVDGLIQKAYSHQQQPTYQAMYGCNMDAHYSPAEYTANETTPPALVDVNVSENGDYTPPLPVKTAHPFYPSILPPTQRSREGPHGVTGKPTTYPHALPTMAIAAPHVSENSDRSRSGNSNVASIQVGSYLYKPVTYLFDRSIDDWLASRRVPSSKTESYAGVADMW